VPPWASALRQAHISPFPKLERVRPLGVAHAPRLFWNQIDSFFPGRVEGLSPRAILSLQNRLLFENSREESEQVLVEGLLPSSFWNMLTLLLKLIENIINLLERREQITEGNFSRYVDPTFSRCGASLSGHDRVT